jgi:ribonuclease Z
MPPSQPDTRGAISVQAGPYTLRGMSVGGVYTTVHVPELSVLLDVGLPLRAVCAADHIFLSHGHVDHMGGLLGLLGVRGMMKKAGPPRVYAHASILDDVQSMLATASRLQRFPLEIDPVPMTPGSERLIGNNLWVRAFRTHHPVPSLGYQFYRKVQKLKPAYKGLPGPEIAARKGRGEDLFVEAEHLELCYATDTLVRVLETNPSMLKSRVLILECTFYDERKSLADARAGGHIHFDELLEWADRFENDHLVLMHTSQIYSPREVREILQRRCPEPLRERIVIFAPERGGWL